MASPPYHENSRGSPAFPATLPPLRVLGEEASPVCPLTPTAHIRHTSGCTSLHRLNAAWYANSGSHDAPPPLQAHGLPQSHKTRQMRSFDCVAAVGWFCLHGAHSCESDARSPAQSASAPPDVFGYHVNPSVAQFSADLLTGFAVDLPILNQTAENGPRKPCKRFVALASIGSP